EGVQLAPAEHVVLAVRRLAEGVQADGDHGAEVDDQGDDLEDEIHEGTPISGEGTGAWGRRGRVTASRGRHRTPGEDPAEQARDGPGRTSAAERSPTGRPKAPGDQGDLDLTPRCRRSQRCERSCGRKVTSLAIRAKLTEVPELPPGHARRARGN